MSAISLRASRIGSIFLRMVASMFRAPMKVWKICTGSTALSESMVGAFRMVSPTDAPPHVVVAR